MAKIRHRIEHDGQVFTRNSAGRTYRYAVLSPISLAADLARAEAGARWDWGANQEHHQACAERRYEGVARYPEQYPPEKVDAMAARALAWLALGLDGHIAQALEKAEARWREAFPERDAAWACAGWCGRLDLAQKLADPGDVILAAVVL